MRAPFVVVYLLWAGLGSALTGCCSSPLVGCGGGPRFGNPCCDSGTSYCSVDTCATQPMVFETLGCQTVVEHERACRPACRPQTDWCERFTDAHYRTVGWLDEESHRFLGYSKCKSQRFRKLFQPGCEEGCSTHGSGCTTCSPAGVPTSPSAPLIPPAAPSYGKRSPNIPSGSYYSPPAGMPQLGSPPEPGMVPLGDGSWASPWREVAPGERQATSGPATTSRPAGFHEPSLMPADDEA